MNLASKVAVELYNDVRLQPNPSDIASCSVNLRPLRKLLVGIKNEAMVQQIKRLPESHNDGRAIKDLDLKKQPMVVP